MFVRSDTSVSQRQAFPAAYLNIVHKNITLTSTNWTKMHGSRFTENWNNSKSCATNCHGNGLRKEQGKLSNTIMHLWFIKHCGRRQLLSVKYILQTVCSLKTHD